LIKFTRAAAFFRFSFFRILYRCTSTVFTEMLRASAISLEELPFLMKEMISISRCEREFSPAVAGLRR
jgi:hypothetical protein